MIIYTVVRFCSNGWAQYLTVNAHFAFFFALNVPLRAIIKCGNLLICVHFVGIEPPLFSVVATLHISQPPPL